MKTIAYLSVSRDTADAIFRAISDTVETSDARLIRIDESLAESALFEEGLRKFLASCDAVIAHLSRMSPNLLYEVGVAHGLRRNVIFVAPDSSVLPIDLRGQRLITYERKRPDLAKLSFVLKHSLQDLDRRRHETDPAIDSGDFQPVDVPRFHAFHEVSTGRSESALEASVAKMLSSVPGWDVQAARAEERTRAFDFVVWNQRQDSALEALGNPIAVEVKSSFSIEAVEKMVGVTKKQGLKSILLISGTPLSAKMRRSIGSTGHRVGVVVVSLDIADLESIDSADTLTRKLRQGVFGLRTI